MKGLFLIFHGFEDSNGISKKIRYQVKALKECGMDIRTCWLDDTDNRKRRMTDNEVLADYGGGIKGKILKRIEFKSIVNYVKKEKIEFIYIRYVHNASPFTIRLIKQLKKNGARIVMEIPTYPYDQEYKGLPFPYQRILFFDKCFRERLAKHIDKIVTFSDYEMIWNRPTIRISNGIDFSEIKTKSVINDTSQVLNLIAVATIHPWHGFDRAITGLAEYLRQGDVLPEVHLHIIGSAVPGVIRQYKELATQLKLQEYVHFYGPLFGEKLDRMFDICDFGIGSLARHRSKIDKIKTLKNREYAARGIPFIYSETDDDFEQMPYIMKATADESPLDIKRIVAFYQSLKLNPQEIRNTISQTLSWEKQMQQVINETFKV